MSQFNPSPRRPNFTTSLLFIFMGALVIAIAFGLIPTSRSGINTPPWVLAVFGGVFILVGLWGLLRQTLKQDAPSSGWVNFLFALVVMLAISFICLWIAFGPGQRLFVRDVGIGIDRAYVPVDPTFGRIVSGFFGLLMSGVTLALAVIQGRKLFHRNNKGSAQ